MHSKSYKLIFVLLITSVLFVLALQALWIRNFYLQKQDEFNATVYSALEKVANKINERKELQHLRKKISIQTQNISVNGKPGVMVRQDVNITNYSQVRNTKKDIEVRIGDVNTLKKEMEDIKIGDSSVSILTGDPATITKKQIILSTEGKQSDMNKLVNKMLTEIKLVDDDEKDPDTLNNIIKRVFENKGLFLPYEFSLKKVFKNKDETLVSSKGFNDNDKSFVTDLSANKVFSTHNFLMVQFPGSGSFVFASMRNMLLLSLVLSLVIMGVFYYTMRLILKQKKLSEMKNDFINNMTHELKTPIATISLAADAINNPLIKDNDEKFKDYTRILKEENQKLNDHVERVLEMAMLDKGELVLNKKPVNIGNLIRRSIDSHKLHIEKQGANINFAQETEAVCEVDEEHMHAVFNNLLDNALKYSKEFCTVHIHVARSLKDLVITFKDNGIGIDKDQKEKVFDKFFRAQGGNIHDVKGFGLGLSYVRSIVEAHNGTIELQSEKGKGSEFIIKLKHYA